MAKKKSIKKAVAKPTENKEIPSLEGVDITEQDLLNTETVDNKEDDNTPEIVSTDDLKPLDDVDADADADADADNDADNDSDGKDLTEENCEHYIADENLRKYLETAITNQAKRALDKKDLDAINLNSLKVFVEESCNSCMYGDFDRAYKFAIKCVDKVSPLLLK